MKIIFCDKMPQDITVSDRGAYRPSTKTIYISSKGDFITLLHEIGHYIIDSIIPKKFKYGTEMKYEEITIIFYKLIRRWKW